MLVLSRNRLAAFPAASFVLASFKSEDWTRRVGGRFDCVVSMQAVHELPHKRHARRLYEQVYQTSEQEQQQALADARFANVHVEPAMNGLMLYAGERAA
jgi:hypothetical protein